MFDQMKAMGAVASLLRDKERMAQIREQIEERMERIRVVGEAGGGAARVTVTGKMRVDDVELDPSMVAGMAAGDEARDLAQRIVQDATNDGIAKARVAMEAELRDLAEELGLPDMPGVSGLLGAG